MLNHQEKTPEDLLREELISAQILLAEVMVANRVLVENNRRASARVDELEKGLQEAAERAKDTSGLIKKLTRELRRITKQITRMESSPPSELSETK